MDADNEHKVSYIDSFKKIVKKIPLSQLGLETKKIGF